MSWINVNEQLPQDDQEVLCRDADEYFVGIYLTEKAVWWDVHSDFYLTDVAYWMDIPKLPEGK